MKKKLTQTEAVFYRMYSEHRKDKQRTPFPLKELIPVHGFMGEIYAEELDLWGYVSYEVGARISELYGDNPGLFYRDMITGKSGAKYYGYRIADDAHPNMIRDPKLKAIYEKCRKYWLGVEMRSRLSPGTV